MILWFVLPVFSFFGRYYQYFSFSLYSGKGAYLYICAKKNVTDLLPFNEKSYVVFCNGETGMNSQTFAMSELKSASVPEPEIQKKIGEILLERYGSENISVFLYDTETQTMTQLAEKTVKSRK